MSHRPTISILKCTTSKDDPWDIQDELASLWPGEPPCFTDEGYQKADLVISLARSYSELVAQLPVLIELYSLKIPTVVLCNELGVVQQLITELHLTVLPDDVDPNMLIGILLGSLGRSDEVSELRCQMGLMKTLQCSLSKELRTVHTELDTAADVQREFMSDDVHTVNGASFSTIWKPLGVVSGDVFDITQLDDDRVAFFIADAIGHGISAAMLAMMLNRTLAANRFDPITGNYTEPKDMLVTLNHALLQRSGDQARFATAAYGILNCKTNTLTYAGAGHPPALLKSNDHPYRLLDSDGPLLGVFENDNDFTQNVIQLKHGDTLLLYSDGFESVFKTTSDTLETTGGHLEIMSQCCDAASGDVLGNVNMYLEHSKTNSIDDDLTMICLQTSPDATSSKLAA